MGTLHAASDPSAAARPLQSDSIRPVVAWAVFGAAWLALQLYTFAAWVLGPNFKPAPTGDDPVPDLVMFWVRLFEGLSIAATLAVGWWLWRTCKRDGRLSIEAIVAIAWTPLWWWDGVYNWPRTLFMYNAYFVNRGNWGAEIPGWVNPTGHLLAEPILFVGLMYFYIPVAIGAIVAAVLRRSKARWPSLGMAGLIAIGLAGCMTLDLLLEAIWVHTHLYAYSGTVHAWSLWGGTTHQFPVYEAVFWGSVWASTGFLLYFRDDRGRTVVERGLERVKATGTHTALRILAVGGFFNAMFAVYTAIMWFISFSMDATPTGYPSWLRTGQCGEGTQYECPGPQVPVSLPGSKPIPPFLQKVQKGSE